MEGKPLSRTRLIESLRRSAQEEIETNWRMVRSEIENRRGEIERRKENLKEESLREIESEREEFEKLLYNLRRDNRRKEQLTSQARLADRIVSLTESYLQQIAANGEHSALFKSLASELPPAEWKQVIVNPRDVEAASEQFVSCEIKHDSEISGGLLATTANHEFSIDNTLNKRVKRAREIFLPVIIRELLSESSAGK